jgi:L-lactate dehydrogenase complex protein LldE
MISIVWIPLLWMKGESLQLRDIQWMKLMSDRTKPVNLFITCLIDSLFPEVGKAVWEVLQWCTPGVMFHPEQTCCGQPLYNAGLFAEARNVARYILEIYSRTQGPIVVPSGSCTTMIRIGYPELFSEDPVWLPRALDLAQRTYEFSEFLVDVLHIEDLTATFEGHLAYHPSCHLIRELQIDRQPLTLLQAIRGIKLSRLQTECCGFGGVFAVEQEPISSAMLNHKILAIQASQAKAVVGCDVSCLMHIEGGLRRIGSPIRCVHLAQVLSRKGASLQ